MDLALPKRSCALLSAGGGACDPALEFLYSTHEIRDGQPDSPHDMNQPGCQLRLASHGHGGPRSVILASALTSKPGTCGQAAAERSIAHLPLGRLLGAGAARGSEKKSPPPPSFTCPSLPRTTLLGFGASSSMI